MTSGGKRAAAVCAVLAFFAAASLAVGGEPRPGAAGASHTTFRGHAPGLKMRLDLVGGRIGFDARARVSCADGSEHWQLLIEGGRGGGVDTAGRFRHTEYEPAEAGEKPPSRERVTPEEVEESVVYGAPASLRKIKGRVFADAVVGWIRFWEGPGRTPGSLHSKCGTGAPEGSWVKFALPRVGGPAPSP